MKSTKPRVSVLMSVLNAAPYLKESLGSILSQTLTDLEVILVDDGCSDASLEIVYSFSDPRIVLIKNRETIGLASSLNTAIRVATGKYMARMDADDISAPERLAKQVSYLESNPDVDVLGCAMKYFGYSTYLESFPETPDACKAKLLFNVCVGHPAVVLRSAIFENEENFYNPELKQYGEEYDLWCRLAQHYCFSNLHEPLIQYRTYPPAEKADAEGLRRQNSIQIRRSYLERMLGPVNEEDFILHSLMAELTTVTSEQLGAVTEWMNKLMQLNEQHKAFEPASLRGQLSKRYFELCYFNPGIGKSFYSKSKWAKYYQPDDYENMKFAVKSLLNH